MQVNVPLPIKYLGVDYAAGTQIITDATALAMINLGLAVRSIPLPVSVPVMAEFYEVTGTGIKNIWTGSQAEYDAIAVKDGATLYVII